MLRKEQEEEARLAEKLQEQKFQSDSQGSSDRASSDLFVDVFLLTVVYNCFILKKRHGHRLVSKADLSSHFFCGKI